jgi:hypothetical protein
MSVIDCPESAKTNITIPKDKFYQVGDVNHKVKRLFVDEVERITLRAVIAPRTINITGNKTYDELDVIEIKLKERDISTKTLEVIDSVIPRPVLFVVVRSNGEIKYVISYKELNQRTSNNSKVIHYYETPWGVSPLKISGNSVRGIYINFIKQIEPNFNLSKPITEAVQDTKNAAKLKANIERINMQIANEPSVAKKQELARLRYTLEQKLGQSVI